MACKKVLEIKQTDGLDKKARAALSLILSQISRSEVEEDIYHAIEMFKMARKTEFSEDWSFVIACVAHDIERSLPCRLRPENFDTYNMFKTAHQQKSAVVLERILKNFSFPEDFIKNAVFLVHNHETGNENHKQIQELVYLDVLSFINTNSRFYLKREGPKKLLNRMVWGLKRLTSEQLKRIKSEVKINDDTVRDVFSQALNKMHL